MKIPTHLLAGITALCLCSPGIPKANALTHPGVVFNSADLNTLKANYLTTDPWKTSYAVFNAQSQASLTYTMRGPFVTVGRDPSENLTQYESDVLAAYYLSIQWYLTGNTAYASKATTILNAWATTHTTWSGSTPRLAAGWNGMHVSIAAEILRYTYPGWTTTNTTNMQNYLLNVVWPMAGGSGIDAPNLADANQGAMMLRGLMAIAVFCDDTPRFNNVVNQFLNHPCGGLDNTTLPTGQNADFGRDQSHSWGEAQDMVLAAETAWKQGVDLYGVLNNRLRAVSEFLCTYNTGGQVSFTSFGACYDYYTTPGSGLGTNNAQQILLNLIHSAYVTRKGIACQATDALLANKTSNPLNPDSFLYARTVNTSATKPAEPYAHPIAVSAVPSLTGADIGAVGLAGGQSYGGGVWTVTGAGNAIWGTADSFHFAYQKITGDGAIVARVLTHSNPSGYARANAGVMMRESLAANSAMMHVSMDPPGNLGTYGMECFMRTTTGNGVTEQFHPNLGVPAWVKIERRGNLFIGYDSADGVRWTPTRYMYSSMASTIYVGLCVCAHNTTSLDTATFDNVKINGPTLGTWSLKNLSFGKMIDNDGSTTNGDPIVQRADSASNSQRWNVTYTGGYYKLSGVTGGKYLGDDTVGGTDLFQWDASTSSSQNWRFEPAAAGGFYLIGNANNGLYLDSFASPTDGAAVKFEIRGGQNSQRWTFEIP